MSNRNYYRITLNNYHLGVSKELSAPTRYELDVKIENQNRIWAEKLNRDIRKQSKEEMKRRAEQLTREDNKRIEEYNNIMKMDNTFTSKDYYDSLINRKEYEEFTTKLRKKTLEEIKNELGVPEKHWIEIFLKKKKNHRIEMEKNAEEELNKANIEFEEKLEKEKLNYQIQKDKFIKKQEEKNKVVENNLIKYSEGDVQQIEKYFEYVIDKINMPSDFVKDFEVQYIKEEKTLIIAYYLPNANLVPRIIQHKYINTRNEIDEVLLTDKKFEKFYNNMVYMCCLRTIKDVFNSDDDNNIERIAYNGWVKFIDKSTGKPAESCIISLETNKSTFLDINLDNVDYKECVKGLKGLFAPSFLSLTPVYPYRKIDREDSRFIENKDVANIELDGFNLATMPWEDFEYFVRELFDKMFNANGGEVKVTQSSHDGGVDAIAFDDDPIKGGKFIIQAKRYNNVVPVSAVRDLYGTMIHEGATKGILVTTSYYGKEAYEFAKDKPISLIDGQGLLGLLNKYGYGNLTIRIKK